MSGTHDCTGDAAAYALGALEPEEASAFREHMQQCAVCRDEVAALGGVVQALPTAIRQYEAPPGLRRRVMREVRSEPAGSLTRRVGVVRTRAIACGVAVMAAAGAFTGIELTAGAAATVFQARLSGISGSAQVRVTNGRAELVVRHLTPPGHGHIYEVWLQYGTHAPVAASVLFGVDSAGNNEVAIPRRIHGASAILVTSEPSGGSPKPTHAPVIVTRLD